MTSNQDHKSLSKVELLVLARCAPAKGATDAQLTTVVASFVPDKAQSALLVLAGLRARSLVTTPGSAHCKLTATGRRTLCAALGIDSVTSWNEVKSQCLSVLGLAKPHSAKKKRSSVAPPRAKQPVDTLVLLQQRLQIPNASSLTALCDALLAKTLGFSGKVTLAGIRAHVLACSLGVDPPESAGTTPKQVAKYAASRLGDSGGNGKPPTQEVLGFHGSECVATAPNAPLQAIAANPPRYTPSATADPPTRSIRIVSPPGGPSSPPSESADKLLNLVREAIPRIGSDGRFGPEKVFVSALWRYIEDDGRLPDLSLDRFKRWLVTANRDQLVDLVRADSQGDMDGRLLEESEIHDLGATFHFVIDRQIAASRRGYHAR